MSSKFLLSRSSKYIKSIFDPQRGPSSSPDDRTVRHMLRQETVTAVLAGSSKGGIIIFYPNTTDSVKGYHYVYDGNKWVYESSISIAQDLSKNYNYGRQTSAAYQVQAALQSTSNAELSGYMNAVTYEGGGLSELGLEGKTPQEIFSTILSTTSNPLDKVGNVFLATGLKIISLPNDADVPYTRLNDESPAAPGSKAQYNDQSSSTGLTVTTTNSVNVPPQSTAPVKILQANIDAGRQPLHLEVTLKLGTNGPAYLVVTLLNAFGEPVVSVDRILPANLTPASIPFTFPLEFTKEMIDEPVCAFILTMSDVNDQGQGFQVQKATVVASIYGGGLYGVNTPLTLVSYEGLVEGTQITVAGYTNWELVPNTNLLAQVKTKYGNYDAHEFEYWKTLLGMRDELQLRTVMSTETYLEFKNLWLELGELDKNTVAEAFDLGSLIKGIKAVAAPALSAFIPGAAPLINSISPLIDDVVDKIAPKAMAASGPAYKGSRVGWASDKPHPFTYCDMCDGLVQLRNLSKHKNECKRVPVQFKPKGGQSMDDSFEVVSEDSNIYVDDFDLERAPAEGERSLTIENKQHFKACLFPVVITRDGVPESVKLYLAIQGKFDALLSPESAMKVTRRGDRYVYGCESDIPFPLKNDYTLLPLSTISRTRAIVPTNAPYVAGTSWQGAVYTMEGWKGHGLYPTAITGGVGMTRYNTLGLLPNLAFPLKYSYCRKKDIPLIGVDLGDNQLEISKLTRRTDKLIGPERSLDDTPIARSGFVAYAADSEITLQDLGAALSSETAPDEVIDTTNPDSIDITMTKPPPVVKPRKTVYPQLIQHNNEMSAIVALQDAEKDGTVPAGISDVVKWAFATGLTPSLHAMSRLDATGQLTYRVLRPLYEVTKQGESKVSPAAAMYNRATNVAQRLSGQYRGITADWVMANGARGPDDAQAKYYRHTGRLPEPGRSQGSLLARPADATEARAAFESGSSRLDDKIERILTSDVSSTEWLGNAIREFVDEKGTIPTTVELNNLRKMDPTREKKKKGMKGNNIVPESMMNDASASTTVRPGVVSNPRTSRLMLALSRANAGTME